MDNPKSVHGEPNRRHHAMHRDGHGREKKHDTTHGHGHGKRGHDQVHRGRKVKAVGSSNGPPGHKRQRFEPENSHATR